ncbi:MAG: flagellar hook assembly protein FlgD [Steroidobacteraceae bacterium]
MAIDSVTGASGAAQAAVAATKKDELGQDAFLQLMVAQMKNQDPTNPADSTEFLSQLAQFSTVSGVNQMKESIATLSDSLRGSQVLGGTSLVGHDVLVASDEATLAATGQVKGSTTMPEGASDAALVITDSSGQLIRQMPISFQQGEVDFTWDGMTGLGERAPAGNYEIAAIANVGGYAEQLETRLVSRVGSVSIDPSNYSLTLNTDIGPIALASVRQVM